MKLEENDNCVKNRESTKKANVGSEHAGMLVYFTSLERKTITNTHTEPTRRSVNFI